MIADGGEIIIEKTPVKLGKPLIIILTVASVFVLALGIGIAISIFTPRKTEQQVVINPDPNQRPTVAPKPASKLATDAAVLQLKSDIEAFSTELGRIDLSEPQLAPPNINLNIVIN